MLRVNLYLSILLFSVSCSSSLPSPSRQEPVTFILRPSGPLTRSADPDNDLISDYNLLVFNTFGVLEEKVYVSGRELAAQGGAVTHSTLLMDVPHTILAAANLGYELPCRTLAEAMEYRYYMAYPDEFIGGIPMAGRLDRVLPRDIIDLPMERIMARVDLRLDRRALDPDVNFTVREVKVGNCPSSASLFAPSRAETADQVFLQGYRKSGEQVEALNRDLTLGWSGEIPLYLLENRQDDWLEPAVCSYIEIKATYHSPSWHTRPGEYLIYRFYLQDSPGQYEIIRNNHYHIIVRPEGNGLLCEDSWRVCKEGLEPEIRLDLHPAAYNECRSGEDFHIWCDVSPAGTPMTIEPLAWDDDERVHDLYGYTLDPDGYGLTIHTRKGGSAVIYFSAGPPVNRDTLAMLVMDP